MISGRRKGSLAIRCPACPEVGFNVDKALVDHATEGEKYASTLNMAEIAHIDLPRHKYTLFISADGNFRLQRKHKKDDPDDVALNSGRAYFVESERYKTYLEFIGQGKDVCYQLN